MEIWLFILGYLVHFAGSMILLWKISQQKSIYGLSIDTQICFILSTLSRCVWALDTRIVENHLSYMELFLSLLSVSLVTYVMYYLRYTCIKGTPWPLQFPFLVAVAAVAATIFHPGNAFWSVQILVAFTIYLEAVALIPQLWLMHNTIEIETLTSHYVGLLILSRIIRLFFWVHLFMHGEKFYGLFLADLFHSICSADYFFLWCHKLRHGGILLYKL